MEEIREMKKQWRKVKQMFLQAVKEVYSIRRSVMSCESSESSK